MKNCAFTICATNYIGLAKVLEKSIYDYYKDVEFFIMVADEPDVEIKKTLEDNILIAKSALKGIYSEEKWNEMAFKYDLTEFCTAIKPASIKFFFEKGYEKCIYFDPDILAFSSIEEIYNKLDEYNAIVTPHITQIGLAGQGNIPEHQLLCSGVYNLGFLGIKNTNESKAILDWWERKLEDKCFASIPENLFTDQKWMDLIPCFLGNTLFVSQNLGMNMAPWNFHERKIQNEENELYVVSRNNESFIRERLIFVHFSGYNYKTLIKKGTLVNRNIKNMESYNDLNAIFDIYREYLELCDFSKYADCQYTYNSFEDGSGISKELRRLFRALIEAGEHVENPFLAKSSFYKAAGKMKLFENGKTNSGSPNMVGPQYDKGKKKRLINRLNTIFKFLYFIVGPHRYASIYRVFRFYASWENHYFLIKSKKTSYKIRSLY